MDILEIALRLGAAVVVGAIIGLNRDLHGKSTGVRTLGVVALGAAIAVVAFGGRPSGDTSRIVQGILTGIGFLGVGVIMRDAGGVQVRGLTTAACVWLTASIGAACGLADWRILLVGVPLILVVLHLGGPFEHLVERYWPASKTDHTP